MKKHLNDAEIVTLALLPDESPEARLHLADCAECTDQFDAAMLELERQRGLHRDSVESRDATFWKRQELAIMRKVALQRKPPAVRSSFAVAALLTFALGGFWFGRSSVQIDTAPATSSAATVALAAPAPSDQSQTLDLTGSAVTTDPWESESLEEFQAVVDWESWVDEDGKDQGTI